MTTIDGPAARSTPYGRWAGAVDRARQRLNELSQPDKLAIALHDFASTDPTVVPFDCADGPNGVRGQDGATAFPAALALAASRIRLPGRYEVGVGFSSRDIRAMGSFDEYAD